jgi:hypothetical protein
VSNHTKYRAGLVLLAFIVTCVLLLLAFAGVGDTHVGVAVLLGALCAPKNAKVLIAAHGSEFAAVTVKRQ